MAVILCDGVCERGELGVVRVVFNESGEYQQQAGGLKLNATLNFGASKEFSTGVCTDFTLGTIFYLRTQLLMNHDVYFHEEFRQHSSLGVHLI